MIRQMLLSSVLVVLAAACGGADSTAKSSTAPAPATAPAAEGTARDTCVALFTRQRECTDTYLPALVDARIQHDLPAGIAARAQTEGKGPILAQAQAEWANDSTDAAIGATCDGMIAKLPPEQADGLRQQATQCLAADACQAFTDCVIPMTVGIWQQAQARAH